MLFQAALATGGAVEFTQAAPDPVWVADVKQHRTDEGGPYLSVLLDVFHKTVKSDLYAVAFR